MRAAQHQKLGLHHLKLTNLGKVPLAISVNDKENDSLSCQNRHRRPYVAKEAANGSKGKKTLDKVLKEPG
jgi:hypothetical protein